MQQERPSDRQGWLDTFARTQSALPTLRFMLCGSVDDGKSTLLGRLLYDASALFDDQVTALEADSRRHGTTGDALDFALLVDGLQAEREQGITIDVAYRFFATPKQRFIIADTPGHEQYTRNMATGASTADLAVLLVDARKGILTQTRRHSYIAALFGIRSIVLAVNKMDLAGFDAARFAAISEEYRQLAGKLSIGELHCIPVCATDGDNIFARSARMPWYDGPTLIEYLEAFDIGAHRAERPFRYPVQWVNRPYADFRGYSGTVAGGCVKRGDEVRVYPLGRSSRVSAIITADGEADAASEGQAVTLCLADEIDVSRGDLIASGPPPVVADQFAAHLVWMGDEALLPGREYLLKSGARTVRCTVSRLKHRIDLATFEASAATTLAMNEIGLVNLGLSEPLACDAYRDNRETGGFILIDAFSNQTVAAGMFDFALHRATNVTWQDLRIDKALRAGQKGQRPCVLWFTGLSGAGKSTVADLVERQLCEMGRHTYLLDGDNLRHGLNRDLGFTAEARVENVRRVAEVARLFVDAGLIVLTALISPFRAERDAARHLLAEGEFIEIHISTSLAECERRDPKGLYHKARAGLIPNFTGISSPYEPPETPEIVLDTAALSPEQACQQILDHLRARGYI